MRYFIVTHPFAVLRDTNGTPFRTIPVVEKPEPPDVATLPALERFRQQTAAWNGHRSGPYADRTEAERACTAALATGCFYQVEITEET